MVLNPSLGSEDSSQHANQPTVDGPVVGHVIEPAENAVLVPAGGPEENENFVQPDIGPTGPNKVMQPLINQ